MFLVNGSLLMTPLFPRSGPGECGSPMSQVILRCYDFPARLPGHLFASLPGPTLISSVRVSQLALAFLEGRRVPSGPGSMFNRRPDCRFALTWTCAGSPRFPGDPSCASGPLSDPGRTDDPSPIDGLVDAAPTLPTARASAVDEFRGSITRLWHLLPTLHEWCCHHPCKARFRLAGSPLLGGSRTLWITTKGFRSHSRPPLLDLSWRNVRRVFPDTAARLTSQTVPSQTSPA